MISILKINLILLFFLPFELFSLAFIDEKLEKALISAYNFSPKLKLERQKLFEKDELLPQALSDFRPKVDGYYEKGKIDSAISGSNIISDGIRTETNTGIKITQPIFNGGSTLKKISSAKNEIKSQRQLYKHNEQLVFIEVIKLHANIASKLKELDLNVKNVEFLKKQLELAQDQFDIGELTLTDVSIAQSRLLLSQSDLIKIESDLFALSSKYRGLIGIEPDNPELLYEFPDFKLNIKQIIKFCLEKNPELKSTEYDLKSLKYKISALRRMKFPSIKLEAEAKKNKGYFRADSSREVMSAYATIDVPLYQSGNSSSKIRETKRQLFSMQEKKKMMVNELKYNIDFSWSIYSSSDSKIKAYKKQIESNKKFLEGLRQELFLGERTLLDVLDAEQELIKSEFDLITTYEQKFNSFFEILFYMGKLNSRELLLSVDHFDDTKNYNKVKYKLLDIIE